MYTLHYLDTFIYVFASVLAYLLNMHGVASSRAKTVACEKVTPRHAADFLKDRLASSKLYCISPTVYASQV